MTETPAPPAAPRPRYGSLILGVVLLFLAPVVGGGLMAILNIVNFQKIASLKSPTPKDLADAAMMGFKIGGSAGGALALGGVLALVHWFFVARKPEDR